MPEQPVKLCNPARCQYYHPGHHIHLIQARLIGRSPWGWRDATVTQIRGRWITVSYFAEDATIRLWHHQDLAGEVTVDEPVRLHEGRHVLGGPFGWVSVVVQGGLGPVPEPTVHELWADQVHNAIVDMRTGRATSCDGDFPKPDIR